MNATLVSISVCLLLLTIAIISGKQAAQKLVIIALKVCGAVIALFVVFMLVESFVILPQQRQKEEQRERQLAAITQVVRQEAQVLWPGLPEGRVVRRGFLPQSITVSHPFENFP